MNKLIKNNKGATAIFLTLAILSAMLFVAIAANEIIQNGIRMGRAHINSTKAYYGAEAGVERILWEIRKNGFDPVNDVPAWTDDECVAYDLYPVGDIDNMTSPPTIACPLPATNANSQKLVSSDVVYWTKYNWDGNKVSLKCTGDYKGITRRMVEISYID